MNNIPMWKILLFVIISLLTSGNLNAQILNRNSSGRAEKTLAGKSPGRKKVKTKGPKIVLKTKKKQEAKEKKSKKDYAQFVKKSQKRSIDIQTPDVQARMKQNRKDAASRSKIKKKNSRMSTKKAGRKYK